ncbi:TPA: hypothetical protein EYG96_01450 [Candidatus Gracilibacteria bacterium]|nr:hypothetical protein [Candidatus Peregrinibacteria bacterium]HIQ56688.1 hypothetical protein [Candidatus Gracilibacteria bacterium]
MKYFTPYLLLFFVILTFSGFHFFIQNPFAEGKILGIFLIIRTLLSLLLFLNKIANLGVSDPHDQNKETINTIFEEIKVIVRNIVKNL